MYQQRIRAVDNFLTAQRVKTLYAIRQTLHDDPKNA
jgi:hypothetical protein